MLNSTVLKLHSKMCRYTVHTSHREFCQVSKYAITVFVSPYSNQTFKEAED